MVKTAVDMYAKVISEQIRKERGELLEENKHVIDSDMDAGHGHSVMVKALKKYGISSKSKKSDASGRGIDVTTTFHKDGKEIGSHTYDQDRDNPHEVARGYLKAVKKHAPGLKLKAHNELMHVVNEEAE